MAAATPSSAKGAMATSREHTKEVDSAGRKEDEGGVRSSVERTLKGGKPHGAGVGSISVAVSAANRPLSFSSRTNQAPSKCPSSSLPPVGGSEGTNSFSGNSGEPVRRDSNGQCGREGDSLESLTLSSLRHSPRSALPSPHSQAEASGGGGNGSSSEGTLMAESSGGGGEGVVGGGHGIMKVKLKSNALRVGFRSQGVKFKVRCDVSMS